MFETKPRQVIECVFMTANFIEASEVIKVHWKENVSHLITKRPWTSYVIIFHQLLKYYLWMISIAQKSHLNEEQSI